MAKKATRPSKTKASAKKAASGRKIAKRSPSPRPRATPAGVSDRDHLIGVIQSGTGCSRLAARNTVNALLGTVTSSLKKNQKVRLVGFGSFEVVKRPARKGRNPATGEVIKIKASRRVRFRPGAKLRRGI